MGVGLINAKKSRFGDDVVRTTAMSFLDLLKQGRYMNAKVLLRFMMELCNANVLALTNKVVEDNKDKTAEPTDITEGKKEEDDEIMVIDTDPNNTDTQEATKESKEKDKKKRESGVLFFSLDGDS